MFSTVESVCFRIILTGIGDVKREKVSSGLVHPFAMILLKIMVKKKAGNKEREGSVETFEKPDGVQIRGLM